MFNLRLRPLAQRPSEPRRRRRAVTGSHARVTLGSGPRRRRRRRHIHYCGRLVRLCLGTRRRPASVAQPPLRHQPNLRRETERPRAHRLRLPLRRRLFARPPAPLPLTARAGRLLC